MSQSLTHSEQDVSREQREWSKAAWQSLDIETQAEPTIHAGKLSAGTDAVSFTLAAFGVPDKHRAYIDALIGVSGGELDWFDASDIEVGQRAREEGSSGISKAAITKWTQRARDAFNDWQTEQGITLIETLPGGQDSTRTRHKTRYKLPLLRLVLEVDETAKSSREWQRNKKRALRKAAAVVYQEEKLTLIQPPRRERFKRSRPTAETYLKYADTYIERMTGQALLEGADLAGMLMELRGRIDQKIECLSVKNDRTLNFQSQEVNDLQPPMVDKYVHGHEPVQTVDVETVQAVEADDFVHTYSEEYGQTERTQAARVRGLCSLSESHPDMSDAQAAVEAFQSVGVQSIGITDTTQTETYQVRAIQVVKRTIDERIERAESAHGQLFAGRPIQPDTVAVIQVDDPTRHLDELKRLAFLVIETSAGNIQGWLAVRLEGRTYDETRRAVIEHFGGDVGASGSMRWPDSLNCKYEPAFRVRVEQVQAGHILDVEHILHMMPVEQQRPARNIEHRRQAGTAYVPDWSRVAALHPGVSRSEVDYYVSLGAAQNGVELDETVEYLMSASPKTASLNEGKARRYAERTARRAYQAMGV